jgi:hypothetical protein
MDQVNGACRPVYEDATGQCVVDDEGRRVYGVYLIREEEGCNPPMIVGARQPEAI